MYLGSDDGPGSIDETDNETSEQENKEDKGRQEETGKSKISFPPPTSRVPVREDSNEEALGIPVNLIAYVILGLLAIAGWFYPLAEDDDDDEEGTTPRIILLESTQGSDNTIVVTVIGTHGAEKLTDLDYMQKDNTGLTKQYGIIGLQNYTSKYEEDDVWHGIDITWDDDGDNDLAPGNGRADRNASAGGPYTDPVQAQIRIDDVQAGIQEYKPHQKSDGTISVSFIDGDRDGFLTQGDRFIVRGFSKNHTANYDYSLEIVYRPTRETVASSVFFKHFTPLTALFSQSNDDGSYTIHVVQTTYDADLAAFQFFLKDPSYRTYQYGEIELQNISGEWHGIDVTWDDDGVNDTNRGNNKANRASSAGGAYTDSTQAQIRIDDVQAGNQGKKANQRSEGNISVTFHDNDFDGKLSAGDIFMVDDTADDEHYFELKYDYTSNIIASIKLG